MSSKKAKSLALSILTSNSSAPAGGVKSQGKKAKNGKNTTVSLPAAMSFISNTVRPQIRPIASGDGRIRVVHREFIGDVLGSTGFTQTSFAVNPGLPATFPWLATMAGLFESYLFRGLRFEFQTVKGSATAGSAMMGIDFDAADPAPFDKVTLMAYHNATRSPVWSCNSCAADKSDLNKFGVQRYTRTGPLAANLDIKTYDVANFTFAAQGCADNSPIGELYVSYDIELITPHLSNSVNSRALSGLARPTGGPTPALPFGVEATIQDGLDNIIGSVPGEGDSILFKKAGDYLMDIEAWGTGIVTDGVPGVTTDCPTRSFGGITNNVHSSSRVAISVPFAPKLVRMAMNATSIADFFLRVSPYAYSLL